MAVVPPPRNHQPPPDPPLRPMGQIPVIARLIWTDGVEWVPALAIRWTPTHVMVSWSDPTAGPLRTAYAWLPAADVRRSIRRP